MSLDKPGLPAASASIDPTTIFVLHYRHGSNPNCVKYFVHKGTLHEAHELGNQHCTLMGFHFVFVKPFLSSFKEDEKRKFRQFGSGPLAEDKQSAVGS